MLSALSFSVHAQDKENTKGNEISPKSNVEVISMPYDNDFEANFYKKQARWMLDKEPLMFKYIVIKMNEQYYTCSGGGSPGITCWNIDGEKYKK